MPTSPREPALAKGAQRMSRVDTAWLRMDTPQNLMMIIGVWRLEPSISLEALRERVAERLLKYRRFRQKVVEDAMGATWVPDAGFDIARHVVPESLRRRRGEGFEQSLTPRPAQIDRQLREGHPLAPSVRDVAHGDRLSEVRPVLDPVEMKAQMRHHLPVEPSFMEQGEQRGQHVAGVRLAGLRQEVEVDDHEVPDITRSKACHGFVAPGGRRLQRAASTAVRLAGGAAGA